MKTQLLCSAATKVEIERMIGYFYCSDVPYELKQKDDGTFSVFFPANSSKAGKQVNNCLVRIKKGRYRFETIIEE